MALRLGLGMGFKKGAGVVGGVVSPDEISGLVIWHNYTALTGYSDGDPVASITDLSGNSNTGTEATNPPTYRDGTSEYEGVAGVLFDAVAERLTVAASSELNAPQCTYILVCRQLSSQPSSGANRRWLMNRSMTNAATAGMNIESNGHTAVYRLEGAEGTLADLEDTVVAFVSEQPEMHVLRVGGGAATYEIASGYHGLELVEEDAIGANLDVDNNGSLTIMRHPTSNNTTDIDTILYELLMYDNRISDSDLNRLVTRFQSNFAPQFMYQGLIDTDPQSVNIFIDGSTAYMTYVESDRYVRYKTASTSAPNTWTDQGQIFDIVIDGGVASGRTARLCKYGSTWYLYYDDRTNGQLRVATGAAIGSLSDYGSNPILSGTTGFETYVRHPFVLTPDETHDAGWHMLYDGRQDGAAGKIGAVGHATSSDGLSWTRDTANNPVISPSGALDFEDSDCGEPRAIWDGAAYQVFWAGFKDIGDFAHWIGRGTSSDLSSVTKSAFNPVFPLGRVSSARGNVRHVSPCPYLPGSQLYLYYCGVDSSGSNIVYAKENV